MLIYKNHEKGGISMSMTLGDDNEVRGGGGVLAMGNNTMMMAAIIIVIVFFVAIIFLALAFKDRDHGRKDSTDVATLLTPLIAAKSMDGNKNDSIDKLQLMLKMESTEDRARQTQTQQEVSSLSKEFAAMGFGLAGKIDSVEKEQLKTYATIQNQLGMQSEALKQILTTQNNTAIINGVMQQLMYGKPCIA